MMRIITFILFSIMLVGCKNEKSQVSGNSPTDGIQVNKPVTGLQRSPSQPNKEEKPGSVLNTGGLEWMNMDQLAKIPMSGSKMYLIDIYTTWCGWCKVMDKKTFSDEKVQSYLTENFHLIKFDAEREHPINFKGKEYGFRPGGKRGNNELALELLDGRMSYPSLVYLDANLNVVKVSAGYKNPEQLLQELQIVTKS